MKKIAVGVTVILSVCLGILMILSLIINPEHIKSNPGGHPEQIQYVKDQRTNLCFNVNHTYGPGVIFSNVPCTPEVEALIKK